MNKHALTVDGLTVQIHMTRSVVHAVTDVGFTVDRGETLGLVGESGSGKSTLGLALMGLLPADGEITAGSVRLDGTELVGISDRELRAVRGNDLAMVFQDSQSSLNPTMTIGDQVAEVVILHRGASRRDARRRAEELLALVGLPRPAERMWDYPHQLSGGQRQRVMIAIALACEPKVLIADEPTTALDVTIQAQILDLLDELKRTLGMGMILITHDMGVVANRADRIAVMYGGRIVETTATARLFEDVRHPYTKALLASIPRLDCPPTQPLNTIPGLPPSLADPPMGCPFAPRCPAVTALCEQQNPPLDGPEGHQYACWHPVDGPASNLLPIASVSRVPAPSARPLLVASSLTRQFPVKSRGLFRRATRTVSAVSDVSLTVGAGETFGLAGESGCGKSTLARMLVGLEQPDDGHVRYDDRDIYALRGKALRVARRDVQLMFQDPFNSLDPRMRIGEILREPLEIQREGRRAEQNQRIRLALDEVGLPANAVERYPHEFSGGQRQRIGLARALMLDPKVIVADEPVSALDVSVRSQVMNLMKRLQQQRGMSSLVISHDLAVLRYLADRIGVMYLGKLVEVGPVDSVYRAPAHPYTAALLEAIPRHDQTESAGRGALSGELPSPIDPPTGCRFRTRCPLATEACEQQPELRDFGGGHVAACHHPLRTPVARPAEQGPSPATTQQERSG